MKNIKIAYLSPDFDTSAKAKEFIQQTKNVNLGKFPHLILLHPDVEIMVLETFIYRFNADPLTPIIDTGYIYAFE